MCAIADIYTNGNEVICSVLARTGLTLGFVELNLFFTLQSSPHAIFAVLCHLTTATAVKVRCSLDSKCELRANFIKLRKTYKNLIILPTFQYIDQNTAPSSTTFLGKLHANKPISPLPCLHWKIQEIKRSYNLNYLFKFELAEVLKVN